MKVLDVLSTPLGMVVFVGITLIGLIIGFVASRAEKTLGTGASLSAGVLGSCSGGIGMLAMLLGEIPDLGVVLLVMHDGAALGAVIALFATYLLKNRLLVNPPAASQNFPSTPISRFCTQCGNRFQAGRRFCPACGSAAEQ